LGRRITILLYDTRYVVCERVEWAGFLFQYTLTYTFGYGSMSKDQGPETTPAAPLYFVAIHGGAGYHPPSSDSSSRRSLRTAVSSALTTLTTVSSENGSSGHTPGTSPTALDTVTTLIAALEDSPEFNAGYGSNLTFDGDVECDAALMDGGASDGCYAFGGVGAVRAVRNPVLLARCVLDARRQQPYSHAGLGLGRVPPLLLVGEGAVRFAAERGVVNQPAELVAPRARREWEVWRERWEQDQEERRMSAVGDPTIGFGADAGAGADLAMLHARQDTVGAVVVQGDAGDVAAGVSRCVCLCSAFSEKVSWSSPV
jgi:taspase (threonine aspartase 1)